MTDVYEFVQEDSRVPLSRDETTDSQRGSVDVDVTSRLDRHDHVALRVEPGDGVDESWFTIEPKRHFLQTGDTLQATVTIEVPAGTLPAGQDPLAGSFRVGAYAESNQQIDFTRSQEYAFEVAPDEAGGVPWWILVAVAAAVVVVAGVAAWLFLGGSDGYEVADHVGGTAAEARADFPGVVDVFAGPGAGGEGSDCVLLQAPGAGAVAEQISLYAVGCPSPSPTPSLPDLGDVCATSPGFCEAVDASFSSTEWPAAQTLMVDTFRAAFTVDGIEVPSVVGLPLVEARAELQNIGMGSETVEDGSANEPCRNEADQNLGRPVLLQHPFAATTVATDATVTLVLTACPPEATRPELVQVDSLIDTTTFANLQAAVPGYATAILDDPAYGPEFVQSEAMPETMAGMVDQFRYSFAVAQVPDVVGKRLNEARTLMESAGFVVQTQVRNSNPAPCEGLFEFCFNYTQVATVVEQSLDPGQRIADLPADQGVTLLYDIDWVSNYIGPSVTIPPDVRSELLAESGMGE